jgi:hypothetical protein
VFVPVVVGLLGGVASWLVAMKLSIWSWPNVWGNYSAALHGVPTLIRQILPFVVVYAVSGIAMALLRATPWWAPWPAWMAGTIGWIVGHALTIPIQGMRFALGILSREIFWAALITGSVFFLWISLRRKRRDP